MGHVALTPRLLIVAGPGRVVLWRVGEWFLAIRRRMLLRPYWLRHEYGLEIAWLWFHVDIWDPAS